MTDESAESQATATATAELYTWLRNLRPAGVVVVTKEGKRQPLSLRTGKSRWTVAARVVMRMLDDVDRVEAVDKRGATLDTWVPSKSKAVTDDGDGDADDLGALGFPSGGGGKSEKTSIEGGQVNLGFAIAIQRAIQVAVDHAVDRHDRSTRELVTCLTENHRVMSTRVGELERTLGQTLRAIYDATKQRAEVEGWANIATRDIEAREKALAKREAALANGEGAELANLDGLAIEFMRHKGILPPGVAKPGEAAPAAAAPKTITEEDM